jgi:hypothetical protein
MADLVDQLLARVLPPIALELDEVRQRLLIFLTSFLMGLIQVDLVQIDHLEVYARHIHLILSQLGVQLRLLLLGVRRLKMPRFEPIDDLLIL